MLHLRPQRDDVAVADTIDAEAEHLGIHRKDYVERAVRTLARMGM